MGKRSEMLRLELNQTAQKLKVADASRAHTYWATSNQVVNLMKRDFTASGVVLHVTDLTGRNLIDPVMIIDGLSEATLRAIHADIVRSHDSAASFGPIKPLDPPKE